VRTDGYSESVPSPTTRQDALTARGGSPDGVAAAYSAEPEPLREYALLSAAFAAVLAGSLAAAERSGRPLPERVAASDIVVVGVATHKVSRLLSKDRVASFLRAPFTRFQESTGQGEVAEEPRGRGLRKAVGELLVCPYCLGQWVAGGFAAGLVVAPRPTRLVASMYAAKAVSDFLQLAYLAAEKRA
jgi:Protein of unknown function (DUF1360)